MNTGDIEERIAVREVVTPTPTDAQNPTMYQHAVYLVGAAGILVIRGVVVLAVLDKPVSDGLIAIGAGALSYIGGLLTPRK